MSSKWHHNFPKIAREAGFTIRELSIGHCIDWRFVASIDPYNIVSERDYEKLDEFIPHISEVPIGTVLNNRILDPAIGKYFILAQFSIQYLLFCKQFLDETVVEIRSSIQELQNENGRLETMNKKKNDEIMLLQRRLQRAESINQQHAPPTNIFPCSKCTKNFISSELLSAHILRKHANLRASDDSTDRKSSNTDTSLINTIKLELEVKQLKERLNAAEKDLSHQRCSKDHRCRSCTDEQSNGSVAPETPKPKILRHSIGIQSNLMDEKDLNEKEVQTQIDVDQSSRNTSASPLPAVQTVPPRMENFISKADLQSFLEEQKQLYEIWKTSERQSIDRQIEAAIGVDPKSKQLSGDGLNAACEALVQRRDTQKKKHKNFFVTRNQLIAKVDQMARLKMTENPSAPATEKLIVKKRENVARKMPKPTSPPPLATRMTRYSPVLELLPSKQQLQVPTDKTATSTTDMNVFKSKSAITTSPASARPLIKLSGDDVITVHAEITPVAAAEVSPHSPVPLKRGSISTHDQHVERLLDTPIKTLSAMALSTSKEPHPTATSLEQNNSDISEILETVPFHPKPMPKKRVLFNLDRSDGLVDAGTSSNKPQPIIQKGKRTEQLVSSQNAKVEEDSDWNISSFDEEK
ncbi:cilium assembly protein DZIP1L [Anopheles darlingi]|uniref:cilium assembly protein DZIP1L n=1 Tax=Anopheles darlingi TaxID=43151 RepID=UPI00210015D6|nr:cilium assembly protein DZIP1L [Anopheles darlingi]